MRCLKSSSPRPQEEQYWAPDSSLRLPLLKVTHPAEWSDSWIKVWSRSPTLTEHWGSALFLSASEGWWVMPRWAASRKWPHNVHISEVFHIYVEMIFGNFPFDVSIALFIRQWDNGGQGFDSWLRIDRWPVKLMRGEADHWIPQCYLYVGNILTDLKL